MYKTHSNLLPVNYFSPECDRQTNGRTQTDRHSDRSNTSAYIAWYFTALLIMYWI